VPYQTFQTSDGWIIVAVGNDGQFRKFVEAGGRPELALDERFATNPSRVRHRDTLVPILAEMVKTRGKTDWIAALEAAGVPCGPINELDEVFANEQVVARGMQVSLPHPCGADVKLVRNPIRMSATPPDARTAAAARRADRRRAARHARLRRLAHRGVAREAGDWTMSRTRCGARGASGAREPTGRRNRPHGERRPSRRSVKDMAGASSSVAVSGA
jgi:crotonobetainyl-CoA:carnitine CoA-transferase CaiB-like acyl-CoA transferase